MYTPKASVAAQLQLKISDRRSEECQDILPKEEQEFFDEIQAVIAYMEGASLDDITEKFGIKPSTFNFQILGHALIDFDLSLAASMFLLWSLIGMVNNPTEHDKLKPANAPYVGYGMLISGIAVLYLATTTYLGIVNGFNAAKLVNKDIDKSAVIYEKAMSQDRFNASLRIDYAQIMYNKLLETRQAVYLEKLQDNLNKIAKYEPYNLKFKPTEISLLASIGKLEEAAEMADNLVNISPLSDDVYIMKAQANLQIAKLYSDKKLYDKALERLDSIIKMEEQIREVPSKSIKPFNPSDQVYELISQAQTYKKSIEGKTK